MSKSSARYSRLPSVDTENKTYSFEALNGPSYFTYGSEKNRFKSAFTYSGAPFAKLYEGDEDPDVMASPSLLCRCSVAIVTILSYLGLILTLPVSAWFALKNVKHYERIVTYRLGRLLAVQGPGYVVVIPCIDRWNKVDLRMKAFSVPPQKVITADGATIEIGAEVYFHVKDAVMSVSKVQDLNHSTRIICQTLLQRHMFKNNLADIQDDKHTIVNALKADVDCMTQTWGVEIEKIELSPVKVYSQPNQLFSQSNNPLNFLGPILFPPGNGNAPVKQLQQFYRTGSGAVSDSDNPGLESVKIIHSAGEEVEVDSSLVSAADLIKAIKGHLGYGLVREFGCVYKFIVSTANSDAPPAVFYLDLKNGEGDAGIGEPPAGQADVSMTLTSALFRDLLMEKVSAFNAYMSGQLNVSGDLRAAMKLGGLIETVKSHK